MKIIIRILNLTENFLQKLVPEIGIDKNAIRSDVTMNLSASCTAEKDLLNGKATTLDYLLNLEFGNKFNGMSAFTTNFKCRKRCPRCVGTDPENADPACQIKLYAGDKSTPASCPFN